MKRRDLKRSSLPERRGIAESRRPVVEVHRSRSVAVDDSEWAMRRDANGGRLGVESDQRGTLVLMRRIGIGKDLIDTVDLGQVPEYFRSRGNDTGR